MDLQIDPRAGSNKLIAEFEGECTETMLEAGDIAFFGNGPDDTVWYIGIEHKQVGDVVQCIQSGRFAGTQLPGMMKLYDVSFLLIEGNYQPNYREATTQSGDFRLWTPFGRGQGIRYGISYKAFDNFCNSVAVFSALAGKPCIVKRSRDKSETKLIIRDLYDFFQKPWHEHKSMSMHDRTKMQRVEYEMDLMLVEPGSAEYPKHILRKALFQIKGVGWDVAGAVADLYMTMENALKVSQREWESVERIGKALADRIFVTLHGYSDPTRKSRKKSSPIEVNTLTS